MSPTGSSAMASCQQWPLSVAWVSRLTLDMLCTEILLHAQAVVV